MKMKKLFGLLLALCVVAFVSSCGDDDSDDPKTTNGGNGTNGNGGNGTKTDTITPSSTDLTGTITGITKLTADKIWTLKGRVFVGNGATLIVMPGTILKGAEGDGSSASALIVSRGGKIMAEGTADKPIIFTSVLDNIKVGEKVGSNLKYTDNGLWGGLIILGKAPASLKGDATEKVIEGIPGDVSVAAFGGTVADDNSGVLKYVSVRHGGIALAPDEEINGITFGGVGSKTVVENIEVVGNKDDGIEWFGGSVNVKNAIVWAADDDAIDIDEAYSGTIDNFIVIAFSGSDHGLEIDGPAGTINGQAVLRNGSIKGDTSASKGEMADLRDGAQVDIQDVYFFGFKSGQDFEIDADGTVDPNDADSKFSDNSEGSDNYKNGGSTGIILKNIEFANKWLDGTDASFAKIFADKYTEDATGAEDATAKAQSDANEAKFATDNKLVGSATVGADKSAFSGWSMSDAKGKLADF